MRGLIRYLRDTWWVFLIAAVVVVGMTVVTGWVLCLAFLPVLALMALYMSFVRYDGEGNERFPQPQSRVKDSRRE